MTPTLPGTYQNFPSLLGLPILVRLQRKLEAQLVPLTMIAEREKAVRAEIDALFVALDFAPGTAVTVGPYVVTHHGRAGTTRVNTQALILRLEAAGLDRGLVDQILKDSSETGEPSTWASVKPAKGTTAKLPMAKAALPAQRPTG